MESLPKDDKKQSAKDALFNFKRLKNNKHSCCLQHSVNSDHALQYILLAHGCTFKYT